MTKEIRPRNQTRMAALLAVAAVSVLFGDADVIPNYHYYYEPAVVRQDYAPDNMVEFDYGISDTTEGYLVPGIEVRVSRFRRNSENGYGSYDSFRRLVKPVAAGLFQYGLLAILALFVVVWLLVALSKWQRPVHLAARRRSVEHRHLVYLMRQRRIKRDMPNYDSLIRPKADRKSGRGVE